MHQYLSKVLPANDNFLAAISSDSTFIYVQKGVRCPIKFSTYFRTNAAKNGKFDRTILIAHDSDVSYI
ncbi:MAG: hypothetical protein ACSLEL_05070 [Candidatus Malihini olakiniferum]